MQTVEAITGSNEGGRQESWYAPFKAVTDFALALLLLVLTGPLILLLVVLVRLTSPGPGIYSQVRIGHLGQRFTIYKIRTMSHDCERASGPRWSTAGDPRVTPLGRWLRRLHFDELPQLWNVLRGDMSMVGPRPERPEFTQQLERVIPGYRRRLQVRPGITGLAQVQLPPDEDLAGVRRKVACDGVYVSKMSPWLDLRILAGTVFKVFGIPFEVTRRVLVLPGLEDPCEESSLPDELPVEVAPQMQTA